MPDRLVPGRPIRARPIARLAELAEGVAGLAAPGPASGAYGHHLADGDRDPGFPARLTGSASPYGIVEVYGTAGGGHADLPGGRSCPACADELNALGGLGGQVVPRVRPGAPGAYAFRYNRIGSGSPPPCPVVACIRVADCCNVKLGGLTVTWSQGGVTRATCTTDFVTGECCVDLQAWGVGSYDWSVSGYGFATLTGTATLACGDNPAIDVGQTPPATITVTDSVTGTMTSYPFGSTGCSLYDVAPGTIAAYDGAETITVLAPARDSGCVSFYPGTLPVPFYFSGCRSRLVSAAGCKLPFAQPSFRSDACGPATGDLILPSPRVLAESASCDPFAASYTVDFRPSNAQAHLYNLGLIAFQESWLFALVFPGPVTFTTT